MSKQGYEQGKTAAENWISELPEQDPELVKKWMAWNQKADLDEVYAENANPSHHRFIASFIDGVQDA